ncbi:MAG: hypothetical protein Q9226_004182 [Calogaya cf. arnoldii]
MRLLHTGRLEFQEFFDSQTPKYGILSHRWTSDEVSFQDFDHYKTQKKPSFSKINNFCSLAKNNDCEWVWIDTCCIDKRSSAELTEAINSMYAWYQKAGICCAYLADVLLVEDEFGNWEGTREEFRRSAWFTRGWTLQELLAPENVVFIDREWNWIGFKGQTPTTGRSLERDISDATGIKEEDLRGRPTVQCVAKKLSWVSRRETTRLEDMAYCMLGLCGVNMPLLYGEGEKAFYRLQLEIIKNSDDDSIFAWFCDNDGRLSSFVSGMIASSPRNFAGSGHVLGPKHIPVRQPQNELPYYMTNKGLAYPVSQLENCVDEQTTNTLSHLLPLKCTIKSHNNIDDLDYWSLDIQRRRVIIYLIMLPDGWRRLQIKDRYVISQSNPGNIPLEGRVHMFEATYICNADLLLIEDIDVFWLKKYRPPQGWESDVL